MKTVIKALERQLIELDRNTSSNLNKITELTAQIEEYAEWNEYNRIAKDEATSALDILRKL